MLLHHGLAGSRLQLLNNLIFDSEKVDSSGSAFFLRFFGELGTDLPPGSASVAFSGCYYKLVLCLSNWYCDLYSLDSETILRDII